MKSSFLLFFLIAFVMAMSASSFELSGHDNQRVAQWLIGFFSLYFLVFFSCKGLLVGFFSIRKRCIFLFILFFGVMSSIRSHQPSWALVELSLLLLCSCITMAFAQQRYHGGERLDTILIGFVVVLCTVKVLQFLSSTLAAFLSSAPVIDTDLLLDGFSNKRFYGQFQTFTLALVALPVLYPVRRVYRFLLFGLLSLWWMIAITGGTRGTWLGMGGAIVLALSIGQIGRRWATLQLTAILTGIVLFIVTFKGLPDWLGITVDNFAGDRLSTSLSAREVLWQQAWEMIKARPLLGFGPMHFADIWNSVGAHPHQAVLQWASEWGIPSTLCIIGLVFNGFFVTWRLLKRRAFSCKTVDLLRFCLTASLVAALTQAMVDGVIVMPYSQLWLALICGWLLALHERPQQMGQAHSMTTSLWLVSLVMATGLILYVVVRDLPATDVRAHLYAQEFGGRYLPRFWRQGVIALPHTDVLQADHASTSRTY